jgi:hypothetical protein
VQNEQNSRFKLQTWIQAWMKHLAYQLCPAPPWCRASTSTPCSDFHGFMLQLPSAERQPAGTDFSLQVRNTNRPCYHPVSMNLLNFADRGRAPPTHPLLDTIGLPCGCLLLLLTIKLAGQAACRILIRTIKARDAVRLDARSARPTM